MKFREKIGPLLHLNATRPLDKLFRSFTLSILICILKEKWAYPKAIFIFYFTKNVYLNYTDLRARRASEVDGGGGGGGGYTDV